MNKWEICFFFSQCGHRRPSKESYVMVPSPRLLGLGSKLLATCSACSTKILHVPDLIYNPFMLSLSRVRPYCMIYAVNKSIILNTIRLGSFTQRRWRSQREQQKSNRFRLAKQQMSTCITLLCSFLCRHCTTTTWKCLISRFVENANTIQQVYFSFPELRYILLEFNSRKMANIWRTERDEISPIKFEEERLQFLSDVFVAVALVVVYKLPISD